MLDRLHSRLSVAARHDISCIDDIILLKKNSKVCLPADYIAFLQVHPEVELYVDDTAVCLRLWNAPGVLEMNAAYEIASALGRALAIGDDEGGRAIVYIQEQKEIKPALYLVPFGCLDIDDTISFVIH